MQLKNSEKQQMETILAQMLWDGNKVKTTFY